MSRIGLFRTLVAVTVCAVPAWLGPAARGQQVPAGFEIVRLTYDLGIHSVPDINDRGDVVWASAFPPPIDESDIWLYRDGEVRQVTNDHWYDTYPAINNKGMLAWTRLTGYYGRPFIVYDVGFGPQAAPDPGGIGAAPPQINDDGLIVWSQRLAVNPSWDEIFSYDYKTQRFEQLTFNGLSNQGARLNRYADMVWTRYDDRVWPWRSTIMLYSAGEILELANGSGEPQAPDLNDRRQVVWSCGYGCPTLGIHLWEAGKASVVTEDGTVPRINNKGRVVFYRWNDGQQRWEMWLYRDAKFRRIPNMGVSFGGASMNARGEIAWKERMKYEPRESAIFLMRRVAPVKATFQAPAAGRSPRPSVRKPLEGPR